MSRIRVAINGRFLSQRITGVQRTARELLLALDRLIADDEANSRQWQFTVLTPKNARLDLHLQHLPVRRVDWLSGQLWEQVALPWYTRSSVLLSLANTGPVFGGRQVATIYDASVFAVPSAYSRLFRAWYQSLLPLLGRRAAAVLTVSDFSRRELAQRANISTTKLHMVPLGREHILNAHADSTVLRRAGIGVRPFVLAVGSRSPHKNFRAILRATEILGAVPYDFVFVGGSNTRVFNDAPVTHYAHVKEVGYVSDSELRALYERATCFVFPSLYEGFGLPALEAMACGCPVIASRAASLPEVCGDAAVYFDPNDPVELAHRITDVIQDPELRAELSRRGLERAKQFSWRESARAVLRVLNEVTAR